jgi:hypothetical protein
VLDWVTRRMMFTLGVVGGPPHDQRTVVKRGPETLSDTTIPKATDVVAAVSSAGPLELVFNEDWTLRAGSIELLSEPVELLGTRTRTTVLSWQTVTPQFAPETTLGGV